MDYLRSEPAPLTPHALYRLLEIAATTTDYDVRRAAMQLFERETNPLCVILPESSAGIDSRPSTPDEER